MPTVTERLRHIDLKVKRAKEHVADLQREISRFLDTQPYKVGTKRDPQSRKLIYYMLSVEPTPQCLPLILGDAVQNLMSALDHLAYQIVCSDTGDSPPSANWIYFPIADDATKYETRKHRKMEGASQDTFDAIDAIKPYKGGNDLLWSLYRLNNIEKHRLLITVGSRYAVNVGSFMRGEIMKAAASNPAHPLHGKEIPPLDLCFTDTGDFPVKTGDELLIHLPDAEVNENGKFHFDVAIHESQIVEAKSAIEAMHQFTTLVEGIVTALTPRLRDTP